MDVKMEACLPNPKQLPIDTEVPIIGTHIIHENIEVQKSYWESYNQLTALINALKARSQECWNAPSALIDHVSDCILHYKKATICSDTDLQTRIIGSWKKSLLNNSTLELLLDRKEIDHIFIGRKVICRKDVS